MERGDLAARGETRTLILDAAERLLAHYGYRKMSMEDVAQEAGLGRRTIYLHFHTKEEVALAVLDRGIQRLVASLKEIAHSEGPPLARLRSMLIHRVMTLIENAQARRHSYEEIIAALRPEYMERRELYMQWEADCIADVLREGQTAGEVMAGDPHELALCLILATNALMPFSLSRRMMGERAEIERKLRLLIRLLLHGVSLKPYDEET